MDRVKLQKIYISDKDKAGNQLISKKTGKGYWKIAIKTNIHGDTWLSDFINFQDDPRFNWKEGDEVIIATEQHGQYLNSKIPSRLDFLEQRIERLERLAERDSEEAPLVQIVREEDIDAESLPF